MNCQVSPPEPPITASLPALPLPSSRGWRRSCRCRPVLLEGGDLRRILGDGQPVDEERRRGVQERPQYRQDEPGPEDPGRPPKARLTRSRAAPKKPVPPTSRRSASKLVLAGVTLLPFSRACISAPSTLRPWMSRSAFHETPPGSPAPWTADPSAPCGNSSLILNPIPPAALLSKLPVPLQHPSKRKTPDPHDHLWQSPKSPAIGHLAYFQRT